MEKPDQRPAHEAKKRQADAEHQQVLCRFKQAPGQAVYVGVRCV